MIIVIGEVLFDVFENDRRAGGAPFNFACHLKRMGWPVRFVTRVGDDEYGKELISMLDRFGFSLADIQIDAHHPTGTVDVQLDDAGVPQFDIRKDVAYDYIDFDTAEPVDWASARMLYFGSLVQRTKDGFHRVRQWIRQRSDQTRVFCDINLRPPHVNVDAVKSSLCESNIVKLNTDELSEIQKVFGESEQCESEIDWIFREFSPDLLILTKGEEGSAMIAADRRIDVGRASVNRIVDTVGAGDAFAAVSAMGLLKKLPMGTIAKAAADFAARICTIPGAVPEDPAAYEMLRPAMEGEK